jgi:hypothetical protein
LPNAPFSTATLTLLFGCYPFSRNKQVASGIDNGQQVDKKTLNQCGIGLISAGEGLFRYATARPRLAVSIVE